MVSWPLLPSFLNRKGCCLVPWLLAWPWSLGEHGAPSVGMVTPCAWAPESGAEAHAQNVRCWYIRRSGPGTSQGSEVLNSAAGWGEHCASRQTSVSLPFQGGRTGSPRGRGNKGDLTVVFVLVEIWRYVSPKEFSGWYLRNSKHRLPISWLLQKPGPTVLPMNCHLKFST